MLAISRHLKLLLPPKFIPILLPFSSFPSLIPTFENPNPNHLHPDPQTYTKLLISCSKQFARQLLGKNSNRTQTPLSCGSLHARILKHGFPLSSKLGGALVDAYSKSGDLGYAQKTFDRLKERDGPAWNSILSAQSRHGSSDDVIRSFISMCAAGDPPDQFGFAIVLSACARGANLKHGIRVHCKIIKFGFELNPYCEGSLINMYAKCGFVIDARRLFDGVTKPDTITWTTMISGYSRIGMCEEALQLFYRMQDSGSAPDRVTCVAVISACIGVGRLEDARDIFMWMPSSNVVDWNSIISGYAQSGNGSEALGLFCKMRRIDVKPTHSTLGSVLSAAANITALDAGRQVHSEAIRLGLDSNVFVGSSLINMYAKCGCIGYAVKVFSTSNEKNTVMWNAMLGGYVHNGQPEEVIELFYGMRNLGLEIDEFTIVNVFGACASLENLEFGRQMHCAVIKTNFEACLIIGNAIVNMYAKSGIMDDAKRQFELIRYRDNVSWNAIIVGHVHNDEEEEALYMFRRMRMDNFTVDLVSFASVISACSTVRALEEGRQIHCLTIKFNLGSNLYVGSSLVDLYTKLDDTDAAMSVFSRMPERNVVARNALIAGLVRNKNGDEAMNFFCQMRSEGLEPSDVTFASILPACTGISGLIMGRQLHSLILKSGLVYDDVFIGVSLIGMYVKSNSLEDANQIFTEMPESKSLVLWTAIISGHTQNGYSEDAISMFSKMTSLNLRPDQAAFVSVLRASSDLAALEEGRVVHGLIIRTGFGSDEFTSTALVDMYTKCGDVRDSFQVFEELEKKTDAIIWNSMIAGFAKNGYAERALILFHRMLWSQVRPDEITFLGVLTACSHAGLISKGRGFFESMRKKFGITPRIDHYACVIDLLGRGGHLKEAMEFIGRLPFESDGVIWTTLLAACRMHGDWERGRHAALKIIELEPLNSSPYVVLSGIYATSGDWQGAKMVREAMRERGVRKSPGVSWIVVENKTSSFVAGDESHPDAVDACRTLKDLTRVMRENGYVAEVDWLSLDED